MSADAYAVLGVSAESEDVVVRAAYRALMQKYTSLARLDSNADDRRAREVQAAYDRIELDRRGPAETPGPTSAAPAAAIATPATPAVAAPAASAPPAARATTPPRPRTARAATIVVGSLLVAGGAAAFWLGGHRSPAPAIPASARTLHVRLQRGAAAPPLVRPLPCFVNGRSVGELRLVDCAARNGVATGPLEVGLPVAPGAKAGSDPLPALAPPLVAAAPILAQAAPARPPAAVAPKPPMVLATAAPAPGAPNAKSGASDLWRLAQSAARRLASAQPAPAAPAHAKAPPAKPTVLAKFDDEMGDPLAALMRAVRPARPAPAAAPATHLAVQSAHPPAKPAAEGPDHLDRLMASLSPLIRPPAPAPKPQVHEAPPAPVAVAQVAPEPAPVRAEVALESHPAPHPIARESMAVVRDFYRALGDGDGDLATSLVAPEERGAGAISSEHIRRFYAGVRQPIRVTGIRSLDDSTVFVRYQFVAADNKLCEGIANVATTQRDDQVMIRGIHATYAC
jgi:hypothetical protein